MLTIWNLKCIHEKKESFRYSSSHFCVEQNAYKFLFFLAEKILYVYFLQNIAVTTFF